jgi:hypothetical protein
VAPDGELNLAQAALAAAMALVPAQGTQIDLSEVLASPPTAAYSPVQESFTLDGAFNSVTYSVWQAETNIDPVSHWSEFDSNGFKRGYARSWVWLSDSTAQEGFSRRNYLIETVEEYSSDVGARWRFDRVANTARGPYGSLVREIDTSSISGAFGAVQLTSTYFFVMFTKGNDVYIVRMETEIDDLSKEVVSQAQKQFFMAPPFTIPPAQWTTGQPADIPTASKSLPVSTAIAVLGITAILTGLVIVFVRRRRKAA